MMFQKLTINNQHLRALLDVMIFALIIVFFHFLWWQGGLFKLLRTSFAFHETQLFMARIVFAPSAWIVENVLGIEIKTIGTTLYFQNLKGVEVNGTCSGLKQFYQWAILMILFPGPWKKKLWFIPLGIVIIHLVNILRIVILSVIMHNNPDIWHFSHDWILRPFFYVVIFAMWMVWEEKYRLPALRKKRGEKVPADTDQ